MLQRLLNRIYNRDKSEEESSTTEAKEAAQTEEKAPVESEALKLIAKKEQPAPATPETITTEGTEDSPEPVVAEDEGEPIDPEAVRENIIEVLQTVYDPEIPLNIYEIGLIYDVKVEASGMTEVIMTLTSPACPAAGILPGEVESKARSVAGVKDVKLDLTFDPPWTPDKMSEAAKLELGLL